MDKSRLSFLFHHYVNNSCTEEERQELLKMILRSDNDPHLKDLMDQLWASMEPEGSPRPLTNVSLISSQHESKAENSRYKIFSTRPVITVFTLVLICAISLNVFLTLEKPIAQPLDLPTAALQDHSFLKLPDGSTVILNSGSTLDYPLSFEGKNLREVTLKGEGFFDIKHDPIKPFIVRTENLTTTVLGTAFNVRAFPEDENITVTVTRGKVRVSDARKTLGVLTPDQQIVFHKQTTRASTSLINATDVINWKDRDILFDNVLFEDAVLELEKRFSVNIDFENQELKACQFTATFVRGEELDQILQVICEFNNSAFFYTATDKIVVKGAGCN
jgi:transmembrane sensor